MPESVPPDGNPSAKSRRVRITAELVVEVVDGEALRQAAAERVNGAEFSSAAEREQERDLVRADDVSAVALLADPGLLADGIPGVELVEATSGAEVVVSAGETRDLSGTVDFAALFAVAAATGDDEQDQAWQLTPHTAAVLYLALSLLADDAYEDVERHGSDPVTDTGEWDLFDRLPRISWRQDEPWRRQVARAFDDLAGDLAHGRWPAPRCNAEELALHLAIADAPEVLEMAEVAGPELTGLPEHPDDYGWDMCSEVLFQDHDILMLADVAMDGFEDPSTAINREFGIGDLRPGNWLRTFNNMAQRDPGRGFRP
ncbi:MAG TPA: hypothetical protein VLW50_31810 [Streptosporangiaceae bacterium]|nr:hypothetical protein [Streptosporangiaceae bacterium]